MILLMQQTKQTDSDKQAQVGYVIETIASKIGAQFKNVVTLSSNLRNEKLPAVAAVIAVVGVEGDFASGGLMTIALVGEFYRGSGVTHIPDPDSPTTWRRSATTGHAHRA
jgi:hypothetical protein